MSKTSKRMRTAGLVLVTGIGLTLAYQAYGALARAGQPTAVVTVNLSLVMESLTQRADATARMEKMRRDLQQEQERRSTSLKEVTGRAEKIREDLNKATDQRTRQDLERQMQEIQETAAMDTLDFQAWMAFSTEKLDIEAALALHDLYRSVKSTAAQMATSNGYDLVLVDDSQGDLASTPDSRVSRMDQIRQQIAIRRMLHVNPAIDITNDLIERMNNDFKVTTPQPTP